MTKDFFTTSFIPMVFQALLAYSWAKKQNVDEKNKNLLQNKIIEWMNRYAVHARALLSDDKIGTEIKEMMERAYQDHELDFHRMRLDPENFLQIEKCLTFFPPTFSKWMKILEEMERIEIEKRNAAREMRAAR